MRRIVECQHLRCHITAKARYALEIQTEPGQRDFNLRPHRLRVQKRYRTLRHIRPLVRRSELHVLVAPHIGHRFGQRMRRHLGTLDAVDGRLLENRIAHPRTVGGRPRQLTGLEIECGRPDLRLQAAQLDGESDARANGSWWHVQQVEIDGAIRMVECMVVDAVGDVRIGEPECAAQRKAAGLLRHAKHCCVAGVHFGVRDEGPFGDLPVEDAVDLANGNAGDNSVGG